MNLRFALQHPDECPLDTRQKKEIAFQILQGISGTLLSMAMYALSG